MSGTGRSARAFRVLLRLPVPVFGLLLGREWFVEPGQPPAARISRDILRGWLPALFRSAGSGESGPAGP